jgi:hypothetical protein
MSPDRLLDRVRRALTAQRALLHADPTLAPRLRRDPVALARLLAEVPSDLLAVDRQAWAEAAGALARVAPSARPAGSALHDTGLPDKRLSRLLRGGFAVREGGRWLVAKEAEHADLAQLVALDLCRAAAEHEALRWIADRIALDYARAARRRRRASRQLATA